MTGVRRLLLIAYFIESGLLLLVVPWSAYWDRNYFFQTLPVLESAFRNHFVRGAVSGLGFVNVVAGLAELVTLLSPRRE
jgi:hypothetical protein